MEILKELNSFLTSNTKIVNSLGSFTIGKQIGQGGTSIVKECKINNNDKDLVIKFLLEDISGGESGKYLRFKQSYINLLMLKSNSFIIPQICIEELTVSNELIIPYIIMHKADKGKLDKATSFEDFEEKFYGILEGISFIHDNGIIHRDIKPQNIFFYDGRYVLADFDISKFDSEKYLILEETKKGDRLGNFSYSAPEQLIGVPLYESDWYAFGQVLHYLIVGKSLRGQDELDLSTYDNRYSLYKQLIRRLISEDIKDRPKSKSEILIILNDTNEEILEEREFLLESNRVDKENQNLADFDEVIYKHSNRINRGCKYLVKREQINSVFQEISEIVNKNENFIWWKQLRGDYMVDRVLSLNSNWDNKITFNNYYLVGYKELNIKGIYLYNGGIKGNNFIVLVTKKFKTTGLYNTNDSNTEEYAICEFGHKITRTEYDNGYFNIKGKNISTHDGKCELRTRHLEEDIFFLGPQGVLFNKSSGGNNEEIIRNFCQMYYSNNKRVTEDMFEVFGSHGFKRYKPWEGLS